MNEPNTGVNRSGLLTGKKFSVERAMALSLALVSGGFLFLFGTCAVAASVGWEDPSIPFLISLLAMAIGLVIGLGAFLFVVGRAILRSLGAGDDPEKGPSR